MWIAQFETDKLFHRVKKAVSQQGKTDAVALCDLRSNVTDRDSEEITCPKCREIHIQWTMERLNEK